MACPKVDECVKHKASSLKSTEKRGTNYIDAASRNTFKLPFLFEARVQAGAESMEVQGAQMAPVWFPKRVTLGQQEWVACRSIRHVTFNST